MASQVIQPSARAALEHYKQRDTSKGMLFIAHIPTREAAADEQWW